jgi:predicted nucleic acid-binding Zn ribbon protein
MAITVVCPCVVCGKPVETRRATAKRTCSHTCYMKLNRAKKRLLVVLPEQSQPDIPDTPTQ